MRATNWQATLTTLVAHLVGSVDHFLTRFSMEKDILVFHLNFQYIGGILLYNSHIFLHYKEWLGLFSHHLTN